MLDCFEMFVLVVNHCYEFEFDDVDFASVILANALIFVRVCLLELELDFLLLVKTAFWHSIS